VAQAGPSRLLEEGASTGQIVNALNNFYGQFLNKCIRDNIDYASQQDQNDHEANIRSATKVNIKLD